jgi:hypothetical protein
VAARIPFGLLIGWSVCILINPQFDLIAAICSAFSGSPSGGMRTDSSLSETRSNSKLADASPSWIATPDSPPFIAMAAYPAAGLPPA